VKLETELRYSQKENALFRTTAIVFLVIVLFPYALDKPNPLAKDLLVGLGGVLAIASAVVVSKKIGKDQKVNPSPFPTDSTRRSVAVGLVFVCIAAVSV
jgi:hypothetical protein